MKGNAYAICYFLHVQGCCQKNLCFTHETIVELENGHILLVKAKSKKLISTILNKRKPCLACHPLPHNFESK
jgi:hypothetical protein